MFLPHGSIEQVKVLDFGIARGDQATTALTKSGSILGTPGYMAPEQARGDRSQIDARADVCLLGCVLFECLTGKPAFVGMHVFALLAKLLFDEPPRVRELAPDVPAALDALVWRMLAKDPQTHPFGLGRRSSRRLMGSTLWKQRSGRSGRRRPEGSPALRRGWPRSW